VRAEALVAQGCARGGAGAMGARYLMWGPSCIVFPGWMKNNMGILWCQVRLHDRVYQCWVQEVDTGWGDLLS
jgi:hypothetical protein